MTRLQVTGLKSIGALVASFTMFMLDIINEALIVLVFLMLVDMATGVMRAILTKSVNSTIGSAGIVKKFASILLIGMAGAIEYMLMSVGQDSKGVLILGVTSFFIVNEGISILENCAQLGLPIPPILYNALEKLHKDPDGKEKRLARNPEMDRIDKVELLKENEQLHTELTKEKQKGDK